MQSDDGEATVNAFRELTRRVLTMVGGGGGKTSAIYMTIGGREKSDFLNVLHAREHNFMNFFILLESFVFANLFEL
jgi:hypothetical protein